MQYRFVIPIKSKLMFILLSIQLYHSINTAYSGGDMAPISFPISKKQYLWRISNEGYKDQ